MSSASKGAAVERRVAYLYEMDGWVVMRSAGSLGPADILAMRAGDRPRLIQVKSSATPKRGPFGDFRPADREGLLAMAARAGADALLYFWVDREREPRVYWPDQWPPTNRGADYFVDGGGCWVWQRRTNRKGYGQVNRDGHSYAHRWYFERAHGPIPDGLVIDHLCRNRACVNPDHLEAVTNRENIARGALRKLTPSQVQAIRDATGSTPEIAEQFGISRSYCWHIRAGRARRD